MATTRHRSLVERGGRKGFVRAKGLAHTQKGEKEKEKKVKKTPYSRILKKRIEHIELSAKLSKYFLRSNKSNINQMDSLPANNQIWESTRSWTARARVRLLDLEQIDLYHQVKCLHSPRQ